MKKLTNYAAIAVMLIALLGTLTINAQLCTKEQKAVWQEIENTWNNWKSGDIDASFTNIHKNFIGWNNNSPMPTSYAKYKASAKKNEGKYSDFDFDIEPTKILVHNNAAVVHYYFKYSFTYKDGEKSKKASYKGRWVEFHVKEGGKWILLGDFTYTEPKKK